MPDLRDYQNTAVHYLHQRDSAGLFLDMGLGKTAITLSALTPDHLPALVVAPKRVAENVWEVERDLWRPDLSLDVAMGSPAYRATVLRSRPDITVIGRDNFKDALTNRQPWRTVILDELSGFKHKGSVRWKAARQTVFGKKTTVEHVWGLTGTPSPNGLHDLWAEVYLLDKGERLGTTLGEFRSRYFRAVQIKMPGVTVIKYELLPGKDKEIHALLSDLCLSMSTEGRVDLPPVTHNEVTFTLPTKVMGAYKDLKADLITSLGIIGGEAYTAANAAVLSNKLSQLTAGFLYGDYYDLDGSITPLHQENVNTVREIVEGTGSPVLVFYRYAWQAKELAAALPGARTMDSPGVIKDWSAGQVPVLLAHPQSAGHGLNLQHGGCHTVVWATLPWSLEEWEQGNKRVHRSGQTRPVVIHRIMARTPSGGRTVDHLIHTALTGKATVQDALIDYLESPI